MYYFKTLKKFSLLVIIILFTTFSFAGVAFANDLTTYTLSTDKMTLTFSNNENGKLEIVDFSGGTQNWITLDTKERDFIWQITLENEKSNTHVVNSQMVRLNKAFKTKNKQDTDVLIFDWDVSIEKSNGKVHVEIELDKKTSLTEWSIQVDLPNGWEVTDVIFPILNINKDKGARLLTSSGWGAEYELDQIPSFNYQLIYPSSRQTMQVVFMRKDLDVLYFATHDGNANHKTFYARVGNAVEISTNIAVSKDWNKNNKFSLPWKTSIGLDSKGWEQALVNWYRPFALSTQWGEKTLLDKNIPSWLLNTDLWLHGGRTGQDEFNAATKTMDFFGNDIAFHWYYWSSFEFDTSYPDYLPERKDYDKIVDLIHSRGSHVMPYTNGRLWDTATVVYQQKKGANEVVLRKNQTPYVEVYASKAPLAVACPTSKTWNDIVVDFASDIMNGNIKNDGIYFDQVASARSLPCYNKNHNHPIGGGDFWNHSNREIFNNVRKTLNPEQIMATEQNAECFLDVFDMFLMGNRPMGTNNSPMPLFPLVYSDRAITYGFFLHNPNDLSFRLKNALTVLWGAQLNGGRSVLYVSPSWKENSDYLRGLKNFRSKNHDLFVGGRMLEEFTPEGDNPIIPIESWASPSHAVRGAKWLSIKGKSAIIMINFDVKNHEIVLPNGNKQTLKAGECLRINM